MVSVLSMAPNPSVAITTSRMPKPTARTNKVEREFIWFVQRIIMPLSQCFCRYSGYRIFRPATPVARLVGDTAQVGPVEELVLPVALIEGFHGIRQGLVGAHFRQRGCSGRCVGDELHISLKRTASKVGPSPVWKSQKNRISLVSSSPPLMERASSSTTTGAPVLLAASNPKNESRVRTLNERRTTPSGLVMILMCSSWP